MSGWDFLTVEDVLLIHQDQIAHYGGSTGLRDFGLLESAVAQAQASFGGVSVYQDAFAIASAYLFHLVSNHAFVDGNKRVGLAAALVFLEINNIPIDTGTDVLFELTMEVARGERTKAEIAMLLQQLAD